MTLRQSQLKQKVTTPRDLCELSFIYLRRNVDENETRRFSFEHVNILRLDRFDDGIVHEEHWLHLLSELNAWFNEPCGRLREVS